MHISRTNLNLLVIFEAIYTHGGVTRAAEVLNLTQPTISHALRRLREQVGDPLFVRQGQLLAPTQVARKIIVPIRQALQTIEATLSDLNGFEPESSNMAFAIGVRPLMENTFFTPLVDKVQRITKTIAVNSVLFERKALEADLSSGKLNAAIDIFLPLSGSICRQHLSRSRSVVIARKDHPKVKPGFDLETYLSLEHVMVSSRVKGAGPEDVVLARDGKLRKIMVRCQQLNTALRIVNSSDLVLTMSEVYATHATSLFDTQVLAVPFESPSIDTYLYWHSNSDSDLASQWLRELIVDVSSEISNTPLS